MRGNKARERLVQLFRYGGTAGTAAGVDIGLFWLLNRLGIPLIPAAAISFLLATVVNYSLTARYVFAVRASFTGYFRFLAAAALGFVLNVGATAMFHHLLGLTPLLAKILGVGITFFANFAMNVIFVFASAERPARTIKRPEG